MDRSSAHGIAGNLRRLGFAATAILLGISVFTGSLGAQESDEAEVLAVIDALFDAMRANDGEGVAAVFAEGASLIQTEAGDGSPMTRFVAIADFANAVGSADVPFDEPYWDPVVQVQDHLASVWVKYAFYLGDRFSHCGVDAFVLARSDDGWKIVALADTRERENCALPPDRQPYER